MSNINRDFVACQHCAIIPVSAVYALEYGVSECGGLNEEEEKAINAYTAFLDELVKMNNGTHYTIEFPENIDVAKYDHYTNDIFKNVCCEVVNATVYIFNNAERAINQIQDYIQDNAPKRSQWDRGVKKYAIELVENIANAVEYDFDNIYCLMTTHKAETLLLNGACNWRHYSASGCALCYNRDIAYRLAPAWHFRKTIEGALPPNSSETWIDVQSRALAQAAALVQSAVKAVFC